MDSYCKDPNDPTCKQACCSMYPCASECRWRQESWSVVVTAVWKLVCCDDCLDKWGDADGDGVCNDKDICAWGNDKADKDNDTIPNDCDNCPEDINADQKDTDEDGTGDVCEQCDVQLRCALAPTGCSYVDIEYDSEWCQISCGVLDCEQCKQRYCSDGEQCSWDEDCTTFTTVKECSDTWKVCETDEDCLWDPVERYECIGGPNDGQICSSWWDCTYNEKWVCDYLENQPDLQYGKICQTYDCTKILAPLPWGTCETKSIPEPDECQLREEFNPPECTGPDLCEESETRSCGSTETTIGICSIWEQTCKQWQRWACMGEQGPVAEVCGDRKDNDCDGLTDASDTDCSNQCFPPPCAAPGEWCSYINPQYDDKGCLVHCGEIACNTYCGGILPDQAQICEGDDDPIASSASWHFVQGCTDAACEYMCKTWYIFENNLCKRVAPMCTGPISGNATLCPGDDAWLNGDTNRDLWLRCTKETKCEYTCDSWYFIDTDGVTCVQAHGWPTWWWFTWWWDNYCGDGVTRNGEECDDGNNRNGWWL